VTGSRSPALRGGLVGVLVGAPLFGLCGGLVYDAEAGRAPGGWTGGLVGMAVARQQASDDWGRAGTIFILLLMLAGLIHFAL
jgi:hypothetical protein